MKKICIILAICLLVCSSVVLMPTSAASTGFDIQSGVLVKYTGSDTNVVIPDGVTAIGASAFAGNTNITSVTIPSSVYSVGEQAFYGCTALKSVSGGSSVCEVGDLAFRSTPYLEHSNAKYLMLGHVLLWYNGTSESVSIPTHCTAVASYAFMRCEYLTSFNAYEGLISVGTGAFYGCTHLSSVNLPATVSSVGAYAFEGTPYLQNSGDFAVAGDGVLMRYQGTDTQVRIPDNVRRISSRAFTSSKLTAVTVPESVYAIDSYAFADCVGLTTIDFSEGLVMIGDGAFRGCKSLSGVVTPSTLAYIGQSAFHGDALLKSAALSGNDLTVSYNAFKGCTDLKYVLMSDGVTSFYDNAFDGCSALEGISISSKAKNFGTAALSGCDQVVICCDPGSKAESVFSAFPLNLIPGDADADQELAIVDATLIQFFLARVMDLGGAGAAAADCNYDAEISILDTLWIQMELAGLA